jgi:hypothetical protein
LRHAFGRYYTLSPAPPWRPESCGCREQTPLRPGFAPAESIMAIFFLPYFRGSVCAYLEFFRPQWRLLLPPSFLYQRPPRRRKSTSRTNSTKSEPNTSKNWSSASMPARRTIKSNVVRRVQGDAPKHTQPGDARGTGQIHGQQATQFKPLYQLMKHAKQPFDSRKAGARAEVSVWATRRVTSLPCHSRLSTPILYINKEAFRKAGLDPGKAAERPGLKRRRQPTSCSMPAAHAHTPPRGQPGCISTISVPGTAPRLPTRRAS